LCVTGGFTGGGERSQILLYPFILSVFCVSISILPKIYQYFWGVRLAKTTNQNENEKILTLTVETVCLLSKLNTTQHIEVDLSMDELDLTDAEKKATYQEIKDYVLEQTGLKVSSLYIAQVKQKCGIIERENYNKAKSEDARQPQCPPDKKSNQGGAPALWNDLRRLKWSVYFPVSSIWTPLAWS
jgi:23S rRNA (uracil1939-C5)-methyltransferase